MYLLKLVGAARSRGLRADGVAAEERVKGRETPLTRRRPPWPPLSEQARVLLSGR